ncbi:hypothetical protein [Bacillus atrophaeus]|uniref:hypothetical protein n=1 Tax=Bacillus atrophaeus TaxID=1452 RepID=UPI002DBBE249|nr:hypothetical protein [Bacillus atrophaeus]MEC0765102.1 hypothetical protein [Bacillus atrophaeus]MEC0778227.1 hypothetical protein [Bacillus atrophaeus]MEC0808263.1 hypothetical protein [Bacillus atrophaeus]
MSEITKEKLEEQLQISSFKAISLLQELTEKNEKLAEYQALYTMAMKKIEQLEKQQSSNETDTAPVNA